jgi:DNA-binding CsgD family transcriptional regulator
VEPDGARSTAAAASSGRLRLGAAAAQLYGDLRLTRILDQLLRQSGALVDAAAGSVSLVDAARSRYRKAAERGASCQLGREFPLDEGITGQVAARRRPVVLQRYGDLPTAHLPVTHPAARGAVAAVPIWWRGEVLGVNVAFAGRDRAFTPQEVDQLELLSQVGAAGIVSAASSDPGLAAMLPEPPGQQPRGQVPLVVTEVGPQEHRDAGTSRTAAQLVALVQRDVGPRSPTGRLRVALLHQPDRLRVVLHDDAPAPVPGVADGPRASWAELVRSCGGSLSVERVPGWGVLLLADLPHRASPPEPTPLSRREHEVLRLLAEGLTDRQVAQMLVLARKTVEKHVGAVLRKTGTTSRTAAVVRAVERGWLPPLGPTRDL